MNFLYKEYFFCILGLLNNFFLTWIFREGSTLYTEPPLYVKDHKFRHHKVRETCSLFLPWFSFAEYFSWCEYWLEGCTQFGKHIPDISSPQGREGRRKEGQREEGREGGRIWNKGGKKEGGRQTGREAMETRRHRQVKKGTAKYHGSGMLWFLYGTQYHTTIEAWRCCCSFCQYNLTVFTSPCT